MQRKFEKEVLPKLSDEQRQRLQRQIPLLITFHDGHGMNISTVDDRGF